MIALQARPTLGRLLRIALALTSGLWLMTPGMVVSVMLKRADATTWVRLTSQFATTVACLLVLDGFRRRAGPGKPPRTPGAEREPPT